MIDYSEDFYRWLFEDRIGELRTTGSSLHGLPLGIQSLERNGKPWKYVAVGEKDGRKGVMLAHYTDTEHPEYKTDAPNPASDLPGLTRELNQNGFRFA